MISYRTYSLKWCRTVYYFFQINGNCQYACKAANKA